MARYTGPKNKLMRKVNQDLGLSSSPLKAARRLSILPGVHGKKGKKKMSDYGLQLLEKQKVRFIYGVFERQFRKYFDMAAKNSTATGSALLTILERRLDNVVYRSGFAPTRAAARQLVTHGNVLVNNKKVTIPSALVSQSDKISLSKTAMSIPYIKELLDQKDHTTPAWIEKKQAVSTIARLPEREDIADDINEQLIVEYYSR